MIEQLLSVKLIILYVFIASTLYVHFRGRERLGFFRQLTDHSTLMAPLNTLIYMFSAVPSRPYLNVEDFPELRKLRDNWETIREEATRLREDGHIKASEKYDDLAFNSFFKTGWKRFYLKWYGESLPSAERLCPKTVELVESIPGISAAMFTSLPPGSRLVRHRDPYAGSLRYHLGLVTPNSDRCRILVDGEPYSWRDGEDVVFDETYLHYAENETDDPRVILFCDVARPMKNRLADLIRRAFNRFFVSLSATRNLEPDKVGVLNKIFSYVYRVRRYAKGFKRANRRLYYVAKFVLVFGALYLIFFAW
jgi:beta-hydroxylase